MKDLLIFLLLVGLLWGGYKGMTWLGNFAQSETTLTESVKKPLADNTDKRLNQSAIKEMKKGTPLADKKEIPKVKKPKVAAESEEKTKGQKAMEAVRGTRLDIEGKPRSKEDFYKESTKEETLPYKGEKTTTKKSSTTNQADIKEQKKALAEKGKALAGEFKAKGKSTKKPTKKSAKKATKKTTFNIEKGENEPIKTAARRPQEYSQPSRNFIPSKYVLVAGSFASTDNAVKEVLRLKKSGFSNASIVLSDKNLNLISLGTFTDKAAAQAQAAQIKKAGIDLYVKGMR